MPFSLSHDPRSISDEDLLADMNRVAAIFSNRLRQRDYRDHGAYGVTTIIRRFCSWAEANDRAGIGHTVERKISELDLFHNLLGVWELFGRQPKYSEINKNHSAYSIDVYTRRFGSWRRTLEQFVAWANSEDLENPPLINTMLAPRRLSRQPSERLRFIILERDRFTCCACGATPISHPGTKLCADHVIPWSKGGETTHDNLQTLCSRCNLGKGDYHK